MTERSQRPPTLRDVARAAGVSQATASYALRGLAPASRKTQRRVQTIAAELGYHTNPVIASLATRRQPASAARIAVLGTRPAQWSGLQRDGLHALLAAGQTRGWLMDQVDTAAHADAAALSQQLAEQGVQGLVLHRCEEPAAWWHDFDFDAFAVIIGDEHLRAMLPDFHLVRLDFLALFMQTVTQCRQHGFHRLGSILYHPEPPKPGHQRFLAGALLASQQQEVAIPPLLLNSTRKTATAAAIRRWLDRWQPDAVISANSEYLAPVQDRGLPYALCWNAAGRHSGISIPWPRLAERMLALMDTLIRSRERGPVKAPFELVITADWHAGHSL
jgi:DNA-binding LacI/PurR family transcriptional regulator